MQLAPRTEEFLDEDRRWIGDSKKLRADRHGNVDPALFAAADFPDGVIKSGTVLARQAAGQRLWGPVDAAALDGREAPTADTIAVLYTSQRLRADGGIASVPLYDNGAIKVAMLPKAAGPGSLIAAARAAMQPHFRFYE